MQHPAAGDPSAIVTSIMLLHMLSQSSPRSLAPLLGFSSRYTPTGSGPSLTRSQWHPALSSLLTAESCLRGPLELGDARFDLGPARGSPPDFLEERTRSAGDRRFSPKMDVPANKPPRWSLCNASTVINMDKNTGMIGNPKIPIEYHTR